MPKGLGDDPDVLADGLPVGLPPRDPGLRRGEWKQAVSAYRVAVP